MKRKSLILISLILVMALALTLSACSMFGGGETPTNPDTEQGGTPGDGGNTEGGGNEDGDAEVEITWSIPTFEFNVISETDVECVATRYNIDNREQTQSVKVKCTVSIEEPTFELDGRITYEADFNEEWVKHYVKVEHLPAYTLTFVPSEPNTVNKDGNIAYYKGSNGKYYADKDHTEEITLESTVLPKIIPTFVDAKDATYDHVGMIAHYEVNGRYYLKDGDTYNNVTKSKVEIPSLEGVTNIYDERGINLETIKHKNTEKVDIEAVLNYWRNSYNDVVFYKTSDFAEVNKITDVDEYIKNNEKTDIYCLLSYKLTFDNNEYIICYNNKPIGKLPTPAEKDGLAFNYYYSSDLSKELTDDSIFNGLENCTARAVYYDSGIQFADLNETEISIVGYTGNKTEIEIPKAIKGKNVVEVADNAFADNTSITKIHCKGNVKTIGNKAFYNCVNLKTVYLPTTVLEYGDYAFYNTGLVSYDVDKNVQHIGNYAFANCEKLYDLNLNYELLTIGNFVVANCKSLEEFNIPSSVTKIGVGILSGTNPNVLQYVTVNSYNKLFESNIGGETNSIVYVGDTPYVTDPVEGNTEGYSISKNEVLGSVRGRINYYTEKIAPYAYANINLKTITIGRNITAIGDYAFSNCGLIDTYESGKDIYGLNFEESDIPLTLGEGAFYNNQFGYARIPNRLTGIIKQNTFSKNDNLHYLDFSATSITQIDNNVLDSKNGNLYVNVGGLNAVIDAQAFQNSTLINYTGPLAPLNSSNTSSLQTVEIYGEGKISNTLLVNSPSLRNVWIHKTISEIEAGAFDGLKNIQDVRIHNHDIIAPDNILNDCVNNLIVYEGPSRFYISFYPVLPRNTSDYKGIHKITLFGSCSPQFDNLTELESIILKDGYFKDVNAVGCKDLSSVECEGLLTLHDKDAFYDSTHKKEDLHITLAVTESAFYRMNNFTLSHLDNPNFNLITYGMGGESCNSHSYIKLNGKAVLTNVYVNSYDPIVNVPYTVDGLEISGYLCYMGNRDIEGFIFPDEMTYIPPYFAYNVALRSLNLNNVTHIGERAFYCARAVEIPVDTSKVVTFDKECFSETFITGVDLSSAVTIGDSAFSSNGYLTNIIWGTNIKTVGASAFGGCSGLTSLKLPDIDIDYGPGAFSYTSIQSIDFGTKLTKISDNMFYSCKLKSLTIPANIKTIGKSAFEEATVDGTAQVATRFDIVIADGSQLESIGERAFAETGLLSIQIPNSVTFIGNDAFLYTDDRVSTPLCQIKVDNTEAFCKQNFQSDWNHYRDDSHTGKPWYYTTTYLR